MQVIMKLRTILVASLAPLALLTGCDDIFGLDNFEEPTSVLTGQVVYQGEPVGVRSGGVELELWQPGFELREKIEVHVDQDGTFSAELFDGSYELNTLAGNGPWVDSGETITFELNGEANIDVPVTPFYTIENASISNNGGTIQATFNVNAVDASRAVEFVGLYVGRTLFVDRNTNVAEIERPAGALNLSAPITLSVTLPDDIHVTPSPDPRTDVFVRVGVKTVGRSEMLFTHVQKVGI